MRGVKLIPFYRVSYRGDFHEAGRAFDIDPAHREEMEHHGRIVDDSPAEPMEPPVTEDPAEVKPRRGRPRRTDDGQS